MACRINLRKAFGFGGAGRVAAGAEYGRIRQNRHDRWVVRVAGQSSVAGLAIHMRVLAGALLSRLV